MTKSSSSDHQSDSPSGVVATNRKHRSDRRPLRFWQPFNDWWRGELERSGRRPTSEEICSWYQKHSAEVWHDAAPSLNETRVHAKCLRSLPLVRDYFREYRAKKKTGQQGRPADSQGASVGQASESEQQSPSSRSQVSPSSFQSSLSGQTGPLGLLDVNQPLNGTQSVQQTISSLPPNLRTLAAIAAMGGSFNAVATAATAAAALSAISPNLYQQMVLSNLEFPDLSWLSLLSNPAAALQQHDLVRQQRMNMVAQYLQTQQLHSAQPAVQAAAAAAAQAQAQAAAAQVSAQNLIVSQMNSALSNAASIYPATSQPNSEMPCVPQPLRPTPIPFDKLDSLPFAKASGGLADQLAAEKLRAPSQYSSADAQAKLDPSQADRVVQEQEKEIRHLKELLFLKELSTLIAPRSATAGMV